MKKKLMMALSLVLVAAMSIGGTIAYLTAETQTITNTFTVGNITAELAETTGTSYKIIPGETASKDPTITIKSGSEQCYVYACVDNNVAVTKNGTTTIVATPNISVGTGATQWAVVADYDGKTLYRYNTVVDAASVDVKVPVFTQVAYATGIESTDMTALTDKTIVVDGYAHQSSQVDAGVADAAAKAHFSFAS